MKVYTKLTFQMTEQGLEYVNSESFDYEGSVAFCKGDQVAKQAEVQQAAFNSQLMGIFTQQFDKQSQILDFLKNKMQPMIDNPTGFSKEAEAAMRTGATENISGQYENAQKAVQAQQFALGGRDLPSGVNEQVMGSIAQGQASDTAAAQNTITLQNEFLKQQNYWDAINALNGNAAQVNPLGYASAATQGGNTVANLSQAVTASQQSGLMNALVGGAAGIGAAYFGKKK
jgi:hypothetical protein